MHLAQGLHRHFLGGIPSDSTVGLQGLDHLSADSQYRVESHHGVLKDHAYVIAPHPAHLFTSEPGQVPSSKYYGAVCNVSRLADQIYQSETGHRLTRTRLAHEAQPLTFAQREVHLFHGGNLPRT